MAAASNTAESPEPEVSEFQQFADQALRDCRRMFGRAPRPFGLGDRFGRLRIPMPSWAPGTEIEMAINESLDLFKTGVVVWGTLIQANSLLFSPGPDDCPAVVLFCPDPGRSLDPSELRGVARFVFSLKNTEPTDPELRRLADIISDEEKGEFGVKIPESVAEDLPLAMSTIFIPRRHLPDGFLRETLLPIVIRPRDPRFAAVLPADFWAPSFDALWFGREPDA